MDGGIVTQVFTKLLADARSNISTCQYGDRKQYKLEFEAATYRLMWSACMTEVKEREGRGSKMRTYPYE